MMKLVASLCVLVVVAISYLEVADAQLEVTVKQEDYNRGALNRSTVNLSIFVLLPSLDNFI